MSYTKPEISGYNSNPPSDDGSNTSANEVTWSKHKNKLADPLKTYADAINQETSDAFDDLASTDSGKGASLVANTIRVANVKDYGAAGDGVTSDTAAVELAIAAGLCVYFPAGTYKVPGLSALTASIIAFGDGPERSIIDGDGGDLMLGDETSCVFRDLGFTNFEYCIYGSGDMAVDIAVVEGCKFTDCIYSLRVGCRYNYVRVVGNIFKDNKIIAIMIGHNVYADQDLMSTAVVAHNKVDGVYNDVDDAPPFGILVYGKNVTIDGNTVENVDGATAIDGSGIYTKARYHSIINNHVINAGVFAGISCKGSDRTGTDTPQAWANKVAYNDVVFDPGYAREGTVFGINVYQQDTNVSNNYIEGGFKGIVAHGQNFNIHDNEIRETGSYGIQTTSPSAGFLGSIKNNQIFWQYREISIGLLYAVIVGTNLAHQNLIVSGNQFHIDFANLPNTTDFRAILLSGSGSIDTVKFSGNVATYAGSPPATTRGISVSLTTTNVRTNNNKWPNVFTNTPNDEILSGTGDPSGSVAAIVGTLYLRTDGGASTTLYVKESGTGSSGWAAK